MMKLYYHQIYFVSVLLFTYINVVYLLQGRPPIKQRDQGKRDDKPIQQPRKNSRELSICSRCHDMYILSQKEFQSTQNKELFCIRLLQTKRCIKKSKMEHSYCVSLQMFALETGVGIQLRKYACKAMKIHANSIVNIFKSNKKKKAASTMCRYLEVNKNLSEPRHCGMFGDPHVRTFYDVRQTCIVAGAWSLIDNDHLAVQVTNEIVQTTESTSATATSKVVVIFKETDSNCITQKIYEATSQYLPAIFKDGTKYSGPKTCKTKIHKNNDDHISIESCHINTTIIIRKVGSYLTFNIKMPFEYANKSRGLCHSGCPSSELVDSTSFFENKLNHVSSSNYFPSTKDAMKICSRANLTDFYYDSCVFDLLTTGDKLFTKAAHTAMFDALHLDPKLRLRRDNSVVLQTEKSAKALQSSNGRTFRNNKSLILSLFLFVFYLLWIR